MLDITKPLAGIKVIDFTLAGSGPSCTKLLAEFGAEVIWVEPLHGTTTRTVHKYDFYCTGKKAISLNVKTPEGYEAIRRIIADSDVFVSNYRPRGLAHLHLTYEEVKAIRPDIIYATLTGFGEHGPQVEEPGYDTVAFWAKSGLLQDIAEKGTLVVPPVAVGDISTGLTLFGGICAALVGRQQTGEGCHIYTSLLAQAIYLNHDALIEGQYGEDYPKSRLTPRRALLNTYQCSDGKWIAISIPGEFERYFSPLMTALGYPEAADNPEWVCYEDTTHEKAPKLVQMLDEAFGRMTQDEAVELMRSIDVPVSRIHSTKHLLQDVQVAANRFIYPLEATVPPSDTQKDIMVPASPLKIESDQCGTTGKTKAPALGAHTAEVLKEYGFSDEEIQEMLDKHIAFDHKENDRRKAE